MDISTAIEDFLASLRSERGLARNTVAAYRRDLRQYAEFLAAAGTERIDQITEGAVAAFIAKLTERGLAASTTARKLAAVRGLHGFLVAEGSADVDPTTRIDAPRRPATLPKALSVVEMHALLDAPDPSTPLGVRDRALLELMYATGARVAETIGVRVEDVDLESRSLLLTGKGSKQRIVPLGGYAVDAIAAYLPVRMELKRGRRDAGWLFLNARGGRLTRQGVFRILRGHAVRAGLDPNKVSPHVLRHSAATHMVEGGADLRTVQEILGHANITTTQIYTRVTPQHLYEVFVSSHPRSG